mmetsp:Transcript_5819/g.6379  ORF Transcript_5819/g.6379 Transcript_5819/m.6379 type:complete len:105 (-) Transcript_5819:116-430(-)
MLSRPTVGGKACIIFQDPQSGKVILSLSLSFPEQHNSVEQIKNIPETRRATELSLERQGKTVEKHLCLVNEPMLMLSFIINSYEVNYLKLKRVSIFEEDPDYHG